MSLKKNVAIAAAAGALAAIAVPAMAFENEFHGVFNFNTTFSNFQNGGASNISPAGTFKDQKMNNYFDQRARLQYIAKASDDLKLVTHFELDTRFGGITDGKYTNTSDAGTLDADGVNFETKNVYLDFNLGKNFNAKLGVQPFSDSLKGLFAYAADIPAIMTTTKLGSYTLGLGYSRFSESQQNGTPVGRMGDLAKDLFAFDNSLALSKDTKAGFSYYLLADYQTVNKPFVLHTFGLNGETKLGSLVLSGFAAMQAGNQHNGNGVQSVQYHGYAANVAAKLPIGPGTFKTALLFASGDNSDQRTTDNHYKGWVPLQGVITGASGSTNAYNEGGMMIINRNTNDAPTSTDNRIRRSVTNLALLTAGYDANLTDKVFLNGNVGFAWVPASGKDGVILGTTRTNASDFMGTEINLETGYKVNSNLNLTAEAAYMILGGLYKDTGKSANGITAADPENPYTMRLLAKFKF
jgi:hypothetical protein